MDREREDVMGEEDLLDRLHAAFAGEDGSFLGQLRGKMVWDQAAFDSLVRDMRDICELRTEAEMLERWLADGFWYLPHFVQTWTAHPDFPKDRIPMEARLANGLLEDLAHWFFTDDCPWENPDAWLQTVLPPIPESAPDAIEPEQSEPEAAESTAD